MVQGESSGALVDVEAQKLLEYAEAVLQGWQSTRGSWNPAEQLRAATYSNARDYAGRFLLELLQNGHDAHPGDRTDGCVHVVLDEREGPHGALYVANSGIPFTWDRVLAVCKLAQSAKTVGEGIGNKGIGFRSVLEITDAPEIYSSRLEQPGSPPLDGYRFRFAGEAELRTLLKDDQQANLAERELPPFQVPFPISELPDTCVELAARGNVTVVRLPLRGDSARREAGRRLKELATAKAPVTMFLSRLEQLVLEHRADDGEGGITELSRRERPWCSLAAEAGNSMVPGGIAESIPIVSLADVTLDDLGRFLVVRGQVPVARLREVLANAVEEGRLDESWQEWTEPAVVEIALPFGVENARCGQIYTFLPLSADAAAPLRGHMNAPFFTKVDRTALDRDHPLNVLLFDTLAESCLVASGDLRALSDAGARAMAVDLVSWDPGTRSAGLLARAAQRIFGQGFADIPLVPVLRRDLAQPVWNTPRDAVLWPPGDLVVLTAEAAVGVGIAVADPGVGLDRLRRLAATCDHLGQPLEPIPENLAEYAEQIVSALPLPDSDDIGEWDRVYPDLAQLFSVKGAVLRGRRFLLADDGTLRPCNGGSEPGGPDKPRRKRRQEAFFQPARSESGGRDELAVPDLLKKQLFYLHPSLRWTEEDGHLRRHEAWDFLRKFGLVQRFDAAGLLEHVRLALKESEAQ